MKYIAVLLFISTVILLQTIETVYHTPSKKIIDQEEAIKYANLILTFSAYDQTFNVVLSDNTVSNKIHLKHNRCIYSARIFGKQSYGFFDICKSQGEISDKYFRYIIKKNTIDRIYQKRDFTNFTLRNDEKTNEKHMKIYIINDYSLYNTFDNNIRSYRIFEEAKKILESVSYGDHNLKFVLLGVLNIVEKDFLDRSKRDKKHKKPMINGLYIDVDKEENKKKNGGNNVKNTQDKYDQNSYVIKNAQLCDNLDAKKDYEEYSTNKNKKNAYNTTHNDENVKGIFSDCNNENSTKSDYETDIYNDSDIKTSRNIYNNRDSCKNEIKNSENINDSSKNEIKISENNRDSCKNEIKNSGTQEKLNEDVLDTKVKNEIITNLKTDKNLEFVANFLRDIKSDAEDELEIVQEKNKISNNTIFFENQLFDDLVFDNGRNVNTKNENVYDNTFALNQKTRSDIGMQDAKKADEEMNAAQKLQNYSDLFLELYDQDSSIAQANLIIFYTLKTDLSYIEGLTYKAGACSKNDKFSLIHISKDDSIFYQAKVTAHEILHSLNASHKCKLIMDSQGCTTCREDETEISACTVNEVIKFIDDNALECFRQVSLCGNGMLDPGEECDSGMPFGSPCCTSNCKLRNNADCDDNNGKCCKGCKLVEKGTICEDETECTKSTLCTGSSATCPVLYKNKEPCKDGFCKNGKCQTKDLMCQRIGKSFSTSCDQSNLCQLVCVNENKTCSFIASVYDEISEIITLPDMIPCLNGKKKGRCIEGKCVVDSVSYKNAIFFVAINLSVVVIIVSVF